MSPVRAWVRRELWAFEYLRQSKVLAGGPGGGQGVAYYKGSSHVVWDLEAGCKYPRPLILPLA
jgi:hypothetical protein